MLVAWKRPNFPTKKPLTDLLHFLIENVHNKDKFILKNNINLIKIVIELWHLHMNCDYYKLEKHIDTKTGKMIANILLVNNVWPCHTTHIEEISDLYTKLVHDLSKKDNLLSAECLGGLMNYLSKNERYNETLKTVESTLLKLNETKRFDRGEQIKFLEKISINYGNIASKFCSFMMLVGQVDFTFKNILLSLFINGYEALRGTKDLRNLLNCLDTLLEDNSSEVRVNTLKLLLKTITFFTEPELHLVLKSFEQFHPTCDDVCRNLMYDILVEIHKNFELTPSGLERLKSIILLSVVDSGCDFDDRLVSIWNVNDSFFILLSTLYIPRVEDKFLSFFHFLFLNGLKKQRNMNFDLIDPIPYDAQFDEEVIGVDGTQKERFGRNRMFGNSSQFQYSRPFSFYVHKIEATQTLQFTRTAVTSTLRSQRNATISKISPQSLKRFMAFRQHDKLEEKLNARAKKREVDVKIYRTYRQGELPDFAIKLHHIVELLQILSFNDLQFSSLLFTNLIGSFMRSHDTNQEFLNDIFKSINNILTNTTLYVPSIMETFITILLTHKDKFDLKSNVAVINEVANQSGLFSIGTLLLEQYLSDETEDEPPSAKKSKIEGSDNIWIKLAGLYKQMNEWDVVTSIFLKKVYCDDKTLLAIDEEANGLWRQAKVHYLEMLNTDM